MGKRKAVETAEPVSSTKVSKKNKKKMPIAVQPDIEPTSPKKHKVKVEKLDNLLHNSPVSTPSKKHKVNHHKDILNASNAEVKKSPKKKLKKEKERDKVVGPPIKVEDESDDDVPMHSSPLHEEHDVAEEGAEEGEIDLMEIPKADLVELLTGIKKALPDNDTIAPKLRAKKLKWESVAFGDYTPEKCAKLWDAIQRRQRQYRITSELVSDAMVWLETPWKTAKNKSKHPDFPKRPKSSFLLFIDDIKSVLMKEHKDVKITEMSRIAGQRFKQLSADERQEYNSRAAIAMKKYEEKVEQFYLKYPHLKTEVALKYLGPKKPRGPFNIFLDDHLSKEDQTVDKNAYRMASKQTWSKLKDRKKLKYILLAVAEQEKYLQEVEAYNAEHLDEPVKTVKSVLNKEELELLHKSEGRPIKPPGSAYVLYSQSVMKNEEFALMGARERLKAIGVKWGQISKEDKEKWEKKVHQMQEKYKTDLEAYLAKLPEDQRLKVEEEIQKTKKPKKEIVKKEKRKSVSKRDLTIDAIPKQWDEMSQTDKELYKSALNKVRSYFEAKLNDSLHGSVPDESDGDNANDDEDDAAKTEEPVNDDSDEESDDDSGDSDEDSD